MLILCDIDGCILEHLGANFAIDADNVKDLLPGVREALYNWAKKNYRLILVSGRPESMRALTERQLSRLGVVYEQLILNCGNAPRVLINDKKPDGTCTTHAISLERNVGFPKELINL